MDRQTRKDLKTDKFAEDVFDVFGWASAHKTEVARFAKRDRCGIAVDPDDPLAAAEAIRGIMHEEGTLADMGLRARELARGYDRVNELDKFVRTVEGAARR